MDHIVFQVHGTVISLVNHALHALRLLVSLRSHSAVALTGGSHFGRRLLLHGSSSSIRARDLIGARRLLLSCLAIANATLVLLEAVSLVY